VKQVVVEEFGSLGQYIDVIGKRKLNKVFSERDYLASEDNNYDFRRTHTYEESVELATNGYKEGLDKLAAVDAKLKHLGKANRNLPSVDFVGYVPHVANAIAGVPKTMITSAKVEQKAKVVSLLYSFGDSSSEKADNFITAGKNLLNVIYTLEIQGYRVALNVLTACTRNEQTMINAVQIKNWRQPSNPLKMSYPLIHPSYFRRTGFKWIETQPELEDYSFQLAYGKPLRLKYNTEQQIKLLTDNGVLKKDWFFIDYKDALHNSAEELIKLLGIGGK